MTTLSARARRLCGIVKPICFAVFKLSTRVGKFNKRSGPKTKINPLTREEIQILVVKAPEAMPVYYPLFLCAPRTGLREGELIALKGKDVDFKGKFINVRRSISRGKVSTPKNGKSRRVDMSSQLAEVLQGYYQRSAQKPCRPK